MAASYENFNDMMTVSGPTIASGQDEFINLADKGSYGIRAWLRGRQMKWLFRGTPTIKDYFMTSTGNTFAWRSPMDPHTPEQPDVLSSFEAYWALALDHKMWNKTQFDFAMGGDTSELSEGAVAHRFKNFQAVIDRRAKTSFVNGLESAIFSAPDVRVMEGTMTGDFKRQPFSVLAHISEYTDSLPHSGFPGGAWTTIQGQTISSLDDYKPRQASYSSLDKTNSAGLYVAFDKAWTEMDRISPGLYDEAFAQNHSVTNVVNVFCSPLGLRQIMFVNRNSSSDLLGGKNPNDPSYIGPTWNGMEFVKVAALGTVAAYSTGSNTPVSETNNSNNNTGARYYLVNSMTMKLLFHSSDYLTIEAPQPHPNIPQAKVQYMSTKCQLIDCNRRSHAIVYPSADISFS